MDNFHIGFHKWDKKTYNEFKNSCQNILKIKDIQLYYPILALYIYYHNTKNSHKRIDINRRYFVNEIIDINYLKYYNSNSLVQAKIYDSQRKIYETKELFCKSMPILDPLHFIMNNYSNINKRNPFLPSNYNFNTFDKINDMNNSAYIDTFFGYLCSQLTQNDLSPTFSLFYGSINGISNKYHFDITEEYEDLKNEKWFYKNLGKLFTIDMYVDSDDEDSDDNKSSTTKTSSSKSSSSKSSSNSSSSSKSSSSSSGYDNSDYICIIKDIPVQLFFIEKLEGTLEDFLKENINKDLILSCLLQISFALQLLQKKFKFTHNDLHINNIMYSKTEKIYLYYKFNNTYFKVPTYGYIFKIIDFGRSIFTFENKLFFNDTFNKHGEAEGQYTYPIRHLLYTNFDKELIVPNYNFDLCRLAITILDELRLENSEDNKEFIDFIKYLTLSKNDEYLCDLEDDFNMYIEIAKNADRSKPCDVIQHDIFKKFRIKKKHFPKRTYYTC